MQCHLSVHLHTEIWWEAADGENLYENTAKLPTWLRSHTDPLKTQTGVKRFPRNRHSDNCKHEGTNTHAHTHKHTHSTAAVESVALQNCQEESQHSALLLWNTHTHTHTHTHWTPSHTLTTRSLSYWVKLLLKGGRRAQKRKTVRLTRLTTSVSVSSIHCTH